MTNLKTRLVRFTRFLLPTLGLLHAGPAAAFDYFEHRWIGDVACGIANGDEACVLWRDAEGGVGDITFGDLTALVADHYGTAEELVEALGAMSKRPAGGGSVCADPKNPAQAKMCTVLRYRELELAYVRGWLSDGGAHSLNNDIEACAEATPWLHGTSLRRGQTENLCRRELEDAASAIGPTPPLRVAGDCFAPPQSLSARLRALPDRIALATGDEIHFGAAALAHWRKHHRAAKAAHARGKELLGLVHEAFALHFLSDLHAAGHIRNPRTSPTHDYADAMHYHDQDNETGLLVETAQTPAQRWYAYGDRCLFGSQALPNRAMVAGAAAASFGDHRQGGAERWSFTPPKLSTLDATPLPSTTGPAPITLGLYAGVGTILHGDRPQAGVEIVLSHDWNLTTWWNPLLDLRHGVSFWADGTMTIELASAPLLELVTLPALPFVALDSRESADALRRFGKGIDPKLQVRLGPVSARLDADVGISLVRRKDEAFKPHLLVRTGLFLEVPNRWRFHVPRATLLIDGDGLTGAMITTGIEHSF
jgi:hypothetical protein